MKYIFVVAGKAGSINFSMYTEQLKEQFIGKSRPIFG